VRDAGGAEADCEHEHEVRKPWYAGMLCLEACHLFAQHQDCSSIRTAFRIDLVGAPGQVQEKGHPKTRDEDVDGDEHAEQIRVDVEHLFHRRLIGAATNPAARQRRHAPPHVAGDRLRADPAPKPQHERPAEHDAGGPREKQNDRLGAKPRDGGQVDRQREQHERRWQQITRGDRIER